MPTAAIRGRSFSPPFAKSSGKSTWKSSSVPIQQRALRSCPSDGSSSAPSPGSIAAAAWPRIGSALTERPWRSCALPQSASCSESSVKKQHDPGQTLSTRISASSATCDRNRSLAIPKINRHKSSIGYQHRAILSQLPARLNLRQGQPAADYDGFTVGIDDGEETGQPLPIRPRPAKQSKVRQKPDTTEGPSAIQSLDDAEIEKLKPKLTICRGC